MSNCNTLVADGPAVAPTAAAETPPSPSGGAVSDGTYALTALKVFTTQPIPAMGTASGIFQIMGSTLQAVQILNGQEKHTTSTVAISGTSFTLTDTCPAPSSPTSYPFTATSTDLFVYASTPLGMLEQKYSKR
jgi:hypothetical protein